MTRTLRDLKEAYVIERDKQETSNSLLKSTLRDHRRKFLIDNVDELEEDLQQREQDHYDVGFVSSWNEKAMDYVIEQVDWDSLVQCETCHKFCEDYALYRKHKFCSEGCLHDYEEPVPTWGEKGDR